MLSLALKLSLLLFDSGVKLLQGLLVRCHLLWGGPLLLDLVKFSRELLDLVFEVTFTLTRCLVLCLGQIFLFPDKVSDFLFGHFKSTLCLV